MSVVQQVITCPICGSSRKPGHFNLDENGNVLVESAVRPLLIRTQRNEGRSQIFWDFNQPPSFIIQNVIQHMENTLEFLKEQLAQTLAEEAKEG